MEEIFKSISRILSNRPDYRIDFKNPIVDVDGEEIDGIELLHYYWSIPDDIVLLYYGNARSLKDYDDATITRIFKRVKRYDRVTLPKKAKQSIKTGIDFKLNLEGDCSQYRFNDFNEQEFLLEYNDTWDEQELIRVLEKLVNNKIIKPKECKGTLRVNKEGTLLLKYRYYSKGSNILEKKVHKRKLTIHEWI